MVAVDFVDFIGLFQEIVQDFIVIIVKGDKDKFFKYVQEELFVDILFNVEEMEKLQELVEKLLVGIDR